MTEPRARLRKHLRLGPLMRVLLPPLFTLILIVLLVFTMFFTDFDWQWVTFLTGILFASVLALVSASWKSGWRIARRTAEAAHFRQRLSAEIEQHRSTRRQLERELALHQRDRMRLAQETEAYRLAAANQQAAEKLLSSLGRHLDESVLLIDRDRRYRFHTRTFAARMGLASERIDGLAFEEALPLRDAEALRAPMLDALDGRAGRAELMLTRADGVEQRVRVDYLPQRDANGQVTGALMLFKEAHAAAAAGQDAAPAVAGETDDAATKLLITDKDGNALSLSSLTEELSAGYDPRERIYQAIQNNGFDFYAQDIVALRADAPCTNVRELLIRMRDEEQNLIPPGTFLPIAEHFGLMPEIDRLVVRKAIAARLAHPAPVDAASAPVHCINLARASVEDRAFPAFVARALEQNGISGEALCFEIADGDAISCLSQAVRLAAELKPLGCRLSLDGFGRAGIGFDHVKSLPLDFLKIDGSIILQILRVPEALTKVSAIQRVCKAAGILTIAELVENEDSLIRLRAAGVDYAQGFGVAKPRPF